MFEKRINNLQIGAPFPLFPKGTKTMQNQNGCIMEFLEEASFISMIFLRDMTELEKEMLLNAKIFVRVFAEDILKLFIVRFANSFLVFEMSFNPSLYKDDKSKLIEKSNLLAIIGIESRNLKTQTIRLVNIPKAMHKALVDLTQDTKNFKNYNELYNNWYKDITSRYDTLKLWDMSYYLGRMGE